MFDEKRGRISATGTIRSGSAWPFVLAVFALSRAFFLGAGAVAATLLPWAEPAGLPLYLPGPLGYWGHWDGAWFSVLATEGYNTAQRAGFFPLYPMLVYLGISLGGGVAFGG